tara:strand:+ start:279 stop:455 length:177 start_codon:yes stop_codon:yes gene_type:complete
MDWERLSNRLETLSTFKKENAEERTRTVTGLPSDVIDKYYAKFITMDMYGDSFTDLLE